MSALPERFCRPGRDGTHALAHADRAASTRSARSTFLD
ncbi:hypothetical protein BURMUCGD1_0852 [Burkholderia multivorans CGD1]|nr:hypothetical protein BURMUCGD1_0852 [Burkholderia multivorans CGD1]